MKPDFRAVLRERPLLYDGAMGTMLFAAGLEDGEPPEPWNWERPGDVDAVYRAYYEAGSDVVQTNTFGGTTIKLSENGLEDRVHEANARPARAARALCPPGRFVAGNVGPTGKFLKPMGEFTRQEFDAAFEAQVNGLVDGGVDLISIETMSVKCELSLAPKGLDPVRIVFFPGGDEAMVINSGSNNISLFRPPCGEPVTENLFD